jgi:5-oxoprolinase (ATP-hydrolysing) subunit A
MDINSDMGEGMSNDAELLHYISSTNIACGWHAGDPATMKQLVEQAIQKNVLIGAHPGFPDLEGFGRREMEVSEEDAYNYVIYQAGALQGFANAAGTKLHHVKPHGAFYNQAAKNIQLARGIARAVKDLGREVILYGLAGSCLVDAANELKVPVWQEVFADRRYTKEGFLVPRTQAGAVIEDEAAALEQVMQMAKKGQVTAIDGSIIKIQADTLCIHGDNPHAVEFARKIQAALA